MRWYIAGHQRDAQTGLLVGYIPGFHSAESQGAATTEELQANLALLLEDGEPDLEAELAARRLFA